MPRHANVGLESYEYIPTGPIRGLFIAPRLEGSCQSLYAIYHTLVIAYHPDVALRKASCYPSNYKQLGAYVIVITHQ